MRTLDECLKVTDLTELEIEINKRYALEKTMVGKLYPSILFSERQKLREHMSNLKYGIKG